MTETPAGDVTAVRRALQGNVARPEPSACLHRGQLAGLLNRGVAR